MAWKFIDRETADNHPQNGLGGLLILFQIWFAFVLISYSYNIFVIFRLNQSELRMLFGEHYHTFNFYNILFYVFCAVLIYEFYNKNKNFDHILLFFLIYILLGRIILEYWMYNRRSEVNITMAPSTTNWGPIGIMIAWVIYFYTSRRSRITFRKQVAENDPFVASVKRNTEKSDAESDTLSPAQTFNKPLTVPHNGADNASVETNRPIAWIKDDEARVSPDWDGVAEIGYKECPDCAEPIRLRARMCKECGFRYTDDFYEIEESLFDTLQQKSQEIYEYKRVLLLDTNPEKLMKKFYDDDNIILNRTSIKKFIVKLSKDIYFLLQIDISSNAVYKIREDNEFEIIIDNKYIVGGFLDKKEAVECHKRIIITKRRILSFRNDIKNLINNLLNKIDNVEFHVIFDLELGRSPSLKRMYTLYDCVGDCIFILNQMHVQSSLIEFFEEYLDAVLKTSERNSPI